MAAIARWVLRRTSAAAMSRLAMVLLVALMQLPPAVAAPAAAEPGPLVLAAASLQEALTAAAARWTAMGHRQPRLVFAASSALARQIEAGAPGDLFISADSEWADALDHAALTVPGTRAGLAGNALVLVAPAGRSLRLALRNDPRLGTVLVGALHGGRLALANPDAVPAGIYAKQAFTALGVWPAVASSVVRADNVRAALALVSHGAAALGVVYRTDALAPGANVTVVATFPGSSHEPIIYPLVRLRASHDPDAEALRRFLLGSEAQAILRRYGFAGP